MAGLRTPLWSRCALKRPGLPRRTLSNSSIYDIPRRKMEISELEDFYKFTSGRWLWAEEVRLQERYKRFNIPGLKRLAAKASGAQSCVDITKLAEGGFNKVFRLIMDNDSVVIARIPNPNIGPASKVIASEVATMDFASFNSHLRMLRRETNKH